MCFLGFKSKWPIRSTARNWVRQFPFAKPSSYCILLRTCIGLVLVVGQQQLSPRLRLTKDMSPKLWGITPASGKSVKSRRRLLRVVSLKIVTFDYGFNQWGKHGVIDSYEGKVWRPEIDFLLVSCISYLGLVLATVHGPRVNASVGSVYSFKGGHGRFTARLGCPITSDFIGVAEMRFYLIN